MPVRDHGILKILKFSEFAAAQEAKTKCPVLHSGPSGMAVEPAARGLLPIGATS